MAAIKPIKFYGHLLGPNPLKVTIIAEVLGLPHEEVSVPFDQVKSPAYEAVNPNGRLPAIYDPNTDITIWESGAIIEYLVERYDAAGPRKISFTPKSPEAEHARQWLYLQTTGQGPYYGQAYWFANHHPEKIQGAIDRYVNEINRLTGVLDKWLAKQKEVYKDNLGDGPWLVGNKMSYADLAFIPWQKAAHAAFGEKIDFDLFPHEQSWYDRMTSHPVVKSVLQKEAVAKAAYEAQKKH